MSLTLFLCVIGKDDDAVLSVIKDHHHETWQIRLHEGSLHCVNTIKLR